MAGFTGRDSIISRMLGSFPSDVSIRDLRRSDIGRLHEIDSICFAADIAFTRAELLFYLRHPYALAKVAERVGNIVGFAIGRVESDFYGHVITLDVVPEARRSKIGTQLIEVLHEEFRRAGVLLAVLEVDVENSGARLFYERLGYERIETLRGYYKERSDAYRMARFL
jgi:ribosomal-protein-alanine N-acetyltransferase